MNDLEAFKKEVILSKRKYKNKNKKIEFIKEFVENREPYENGVFLFHYDGEFFIHAPSKEFRIFLSKYFNVKIKNAKRVNKVFMDIFNEYYSYDYLPISNYCFKSGNFVFSIIYDMGDNIYDIEKLNEEEFVDRFIEDVENITHSDVKDVLPEYIKEKELKKNISNAKTKNEIKNILLKLIKQTK